MEGGDDKKWKQVCAPVDIDDLDVELVMMIFGCLENETLLVARFVCKLWNKYLRNKVALVPPAILCANAAEHGELLVANLDLT